MMTYGLGNMMMGSARDGAPQGINPQQGLFGNMGSQGNSWLAQAMMGQPQQAQAQPKKKGFLEQFLLGGGLGLLPAYLMKQL